MKITRRGFGKVIAGALAAVVIPFIPDLPSEDLAAKEIAKIKKFEEEILETRLLKGKPRCDSYVPQITIQEYKIGAPIQYQDLSKYPSCRSCGISSKCDGTLWYHERINE